MTRLDILLEHTKREMIYKIIWHWILGAGLMESMKMHFSLKIDIKVKTPNHKS